MGSKLASSFLVFLLLWGVVDDPLLREVPTNTPDDVETSTDDEFLPPTRPLHEQQARADHQLCPGGWDSGLIDLADGRRTPTPLGLRLLPPGSRLLYVLMSLQC
jgi:hypothetical protein